MLACVGELGRCASVRICRKKKEPRARWRPSTRGATRAAGWWPRAGRAEEAGGDPLARVLPSRRAATEHAWRVHWPESPSSWPRQCSSCRRRTGPVMHCITPSQQRQTEWHTNAPHAHAELQDGCVRFGPRVWAAAGPSERTQGGPEACTVIRASTPHHAHRTAPHRNTPHHTAHHHAHHTTHTAPHRTALTRRTLLQPPTGARKGSERAPSYARR